LNFQNIFLNIFHFIVTSNLITTNNVCGGSDNTILSDNGFIISPNYPSYSQVSNLCTRKIQSPANKVIKLRFIELQIKAPDATNRFYFRIKVKRYFKNLNQLAVQMIMFELMILLEFTTTVVLIDHHMIIDFVRQLFMYLIWRQQQMFY
jgi:hypothetical protein